MSTTRVPSVRASAVQSIGASLAPSWPDTTVTCRETPRWVTGMPAAAGTATALVTPGTTSTVTPASRQAMASSPPRPSTNGSPPLSLTTR